MEKLSKIKFAQGSVQCLDLRNVRYYWFLFTVSPNVDPTNSLLALFSVFACYASLALNAFLPASQILTLYTYLQCLLLL